MISLMRLGQISVDLSRKNHDFVDAARSNFYVRSFVRLFVRSFVCSFARSFVRSFFPSDVSGQFVNTFVY